MERRTVTITLQVEVDGDEVRGSARAATDATLATPGASEAAAATPVAATDATLATPVSEPKVFAGWLGLIGAIDALLGFPPDAGAAARALAATEGTQSR